jgi:hypothetical protein
MLSCSVLCISKYFGKTPYVRSQIPVEFLCLPRLPDRDVMSLYMVVFLCSGLMIGRRLGGRVG